MSKSFSRRALLQALTVGAGSLAFGPGRFGGTRVARADTPTVPGRLVIFPVALGTGTFSSSDAYADYATAPSLPAPGYRGEKITSGATTEFTLGPILQPFADRGLKDQLVYMRGLEYRENFFADAHLTGWTSMLTGQTTPTYGSDGNVTDYSPTNQSVDQYLATKVGAGMPWPSLAFSFGGSASFQADKSSVRGFSDPLDAYSKVFSGLTTGQPDAALLRRLARRKSVLDAVSSDVNAFVKRLPTEDRTRAEAQLTAIRAMEAQIATASTGSACKSPTVDQNGQDYAGSINMPNTVRAWTDIAVAAMACDQTRIVPMYTHVQYGQISCAYAPVNQPDAKHHALSHGTNDAGSDNADGKTVWLTERQFLHQLAAEFADKLNKIPEAGGTMLDHTIIVIPSENGVIDGHNYYDLCWTLVGGKGLGVKTGQLMQLGTACDNNSAVPVQRLFVSILNALGVPDDTFNDDGGTGSGPLPGYRA